MLNLKNRSIAGTAALIATAITISAAAPLRAAPIEVPVTYGDLDIHSKAGAAELHSRIHSAVRKVCGQQDMSNWVAVGQCRRDSLKMAQAKLAMKAEASDVQLAAR